MVDFVSGGLRHAGQRHAAQPGLYLFAEQPAKKADIAGARRLLAEAGHANGLEATLIASDRPAVRTQLAVAMREMVEPAGFDINVQTMPHATYLDQVWRKG